MSFDWSEYFSLAQELVGQPATPAGQEARLRSALSRAYMLPFVRRVITCAIRKGIHFLLMAQFMFMCATNSETARTRYAIRLATV